MKILELNTGLFPDAETVRGAIATLEGGNGIERVDASGLSQDDEDGWAAVAAAVLSADLVVTL